MKSLFFVGGGAVLLIGGSVAYLVFGATPALTQPAVVIPDFNASSSVACADGFCTKEDSATSNTATTLRVGDTYRDFVAPADFLNTEPFTLADIVGKKVIVLEFMTYSCLNCQRTFPTLEAWHTRFKDDGLLVVGIHTPEFAYEKKREAVEKALAGVVSFPVVLDNDYGTWNAYGNRFWPHRYVIDKNGTIVDEHIGEGGYDKTEAVIERLLGE